jgi:hypothetical protein
LEPGGRKVAVADRAAVARVYSEQEVGVAAAANYGAFDRRAAVVGPGPTIGSYAVGAERHGTDDGRKCY